MRYDSGAMNLAPLFQRRPRFDRAAVRPHDEPLFAALVTEWGVPLHDGEGRYVLAAPTPPLAIGHVLEEDEPGPTAPFVELDTAQIPVRALRTVAS